MKEVKRSALDKLTCVDYVFMALLVVFAATIVFPFLNVIAISFSSDVGYNENRAMIIPHDFTVIGYKALLGGVAFWRSFLLTILYVACFVILRIITSMAAGYAISKKGVGGRKTMIILLMIPSVFNGGAVPTYLVLLSLGFVDNFLVFIIPACVDAYHILLVKTYLKSIPDSVVEAAQMDGANVVQVLYRILAPMCIPVLMTIGMLAAIAKWNEWYMGDMFIQEKTYLLPLQNVVMLIQQSSDSALSGMDILGDLNIFGYEKSFSMATIMVVTLPIMLIYPFIQKYFEKGLNVGSVKD